MRTDVVPATCPDCKAAIVRWDGGTPSQRLLMEERWDGEESVRYVRHACDQAVLAHLAQAAAMHRYADAVGAILDARTAPRPSVSRGLERTGPEPRPVVSRGAVSRGLERTGPYVRPDPEPRPARSAAPAAEPGFDV